jgi:predicted DCC family thiol-disulfide oxidoreductase YuxK
MARTAAMPGGAAGEVATALVHYDGTCGACHAAVRVILPRDPRGRLAFASQSSSVGERVLAAHGLVAERGRSLVLVDERGRAHVRSDAVLAIASRLSGPARLLSLLRVVPRRWRDAAYDAFARNRHRLAGPPRCLVVPPALRGRFVDRSV